MKKLIFFIFLSIPFNINAQEENQEGSELILRSLDYSKYDILALAYKDKKFSNTADLAETITEDIDEDYGRYRILFRWVAQNIVFSPKGEQKPEKILKEGVADAAGIANFLVELCDEAGIWAETIEGFAKWQPAAHINYLPVPNHTWIKVKLEDSLYLSDPTWASGSYDYTLKRYIRKFNPTYFISDPVDFGLAHSPVDKRNALVPKMPSFSKFIKTPIFYNGYINLKISTELPLKGQITKPMILKSFRPMISHGLLDTT